jgi:protein-S-isoprenylcysteine O-methyltransferase Ste14
MKRGPVTFWTSALATLLYLGLAVLGRGGLAAFFQEPALSTIVAITVLAAIAGLLSEGNLSSGEQEDRGNRWIFIPIAVIALASAFLPAYTDRIGFWTLDGDAVRWLGVALYAGGGALRLWPVFVLGPRFSGLVAIQTGHKLVTTGIYRVIRNPSYLGLLINALGWALAFRSTVGILLALLYVPPLIARMHAEEALLHSHFGEEYDAYRARTSRLIPGVY